MTDYSQATPQPIDPVQPSMGGVPDFPPPPDDLPTAAPVTPEPLMEESAPNPIHDIPAIVVETGKTVEKQSKGLWAKVKGWFS